MSSSSSFNFHNINENEEDIYDHNDIDREIQRSVEEFMFDLSGHRRRRRQVIQELLTSQQVERGVRQRTYIDRNRVAGHQRLYSDYFAENPTYTDQQFRTRFRMRRHVFLRIVEALGAHTPYFQQRFEACGRPGLSPLQKCTAAIRMLAYGMSGDACDDYVRIGKTTAIECVKNFAECVVTIFGDQYLRKPTDEDLQRLLHVGETRGFPGMLGSIDCMHWEWKNCPVSWQGQHARGDGKATIVLEAVASYDLWIWHAFFGTPGTCNDINVLDRSPVFNDIYNGIAPPVAFTVNDNQYNLGYYLTDGIYPPWATFIQSIRAPQSAKHKLFAQHQEAARKDVERAFGVLQARFAIIRAPALMWEVSTLGNIMNACIILHNMIVEDERDTYSRVPNVSDYDQIDITDGSSAWQYFNERIPEHQRYLKRRCVVRDKESHRRLLHDLIENIWRLFGNEYVGV